MSKALAGHGDGMGAPSWLCVAAAALVLVAPRGASAAPAAAGEAVRQQLNAFRQLGTVLFIAAHPDDENTQLITYLARGRGYRTAYLSITRGDGGQNLLGPEFGELLGVIRTQELLAARRLDGGQQFFTRAIDFGFSKNERETLNVWDHKQALGDVVRVIRTFRPDVIITRFSPLPSGTHGHHTASAVLGTEAFKLSGDPQSYPEQLDRLAPWQAKRILMNGGGRFRGGGGADEAASSVRMDISGEDPVLGQSFGEIAGRSRSMHKSQGFGNFGGIGGGRGGGGRGGPSWESFTLLDGEPATKDVFDGVDTTWSRFAGGAEVGGLIDGAIANFYAEDLGANVPALLEIRKRLAALPAEPLLRAKSEQLDHILAMCLGLSVKTAIANAEVVPGESLDLQHRVESQSKTPVRWVAMRYPTSGAEVAVGQELQPSVAADKSVKQKLPADAPLSQPYWLREPASAGMYRMDDAHLIGTPENPPAFPCEYVFVVDGQTLVVSDEPAEHVEGAASDSFPRKLEVISPVTIRFASEVRLFPPGGAKSVDVELEAFRPGVAGDVQLDVPAEWNVTPASQPFRLAKVGERRRLSFQVTAPAHAAAADLMAHANVGDARFETSRIDINYPNIPRQLLQPRARLKAVGLDLAIRGKRVGYIAGAGDSVAECLEQMGYEVTQLAGADLTTERLHDFDAVVIGIRALNTRQDLAEHMPALFQFIEAGGNVIEQYNRPDGVRAREFAPYDLRLSGDRVTEENAPVTLLAPDHPALNAPNKISAADFEGWVQERGLYFPNQWDEHLTPLLACGDTDAEPLQGGLLVASYGKGHFIYSSLAWFRQLPAGVPGAYRLFANLVSLGK